MAEGDVYRGRAWLGVFCPIMVIASGLHSSILETLKSSINLIISFLRLSVLHAGFAVLNLASFLSSMRN